MPTVNGSEWSASHPGRLASEEVATGNSCTGGWVSHRAKLTCDGEEKHLPLSVT